MYGNDVKARWRHELWRNAARHADLDGWVITLAGKKFSDRKVAPKYGFDASKIVGVDVDEEVEDHNNTFGRTVIAEPLSAVAACWSSKRPVAVINADYCGNICAPDIGRLFVCWLSNRAFIGSLMCLTVSVGREGGIYKKLLGGFAARFDLKDTTQLNRASVMAYSCITSCLAPAGWIVGDPHSDACDDWFINNSLWTHKYRAHQMRMDTCIVRHPGAAIAPIDFVGSAKNLELALSEFGDPLSIKRTVSAKLAWHTMRMGDTAH